MADEKKTQGKDKKPGFLDSVKGFFKRTVKYLKDTKSELKKVVWPSKKQVQNNTVVVICVVAIAAVVLIALDFAFGGVMHLLIGA